MIINLHHHFPLSLLALQTIESFNIGKLSSEVKIIFIDDYRGLKIYNFIYLSKKSSSIPLWNYTTGGDINCIAISEDGAYMVAGGMDMQIYLLYNEIPSDAAQNIPFTNIFVLFAVAAALITILIKKTHPKIKIKN